MNAFLVTESGGLVCGSYQEPGRWSDWRDLRPPALAVDVAAVSVTPVSTEMFYTDVSGHIWNATLSEEREPNWVKVPGNPGVGLVVALSALSGWTGHREIFAVGDNGRVAHAWRWRNDDWSPWAPADVPGACRDVALSVPATGMLECIVVRADGGIRYRRFLAEEDCWDSEWSDAPGAELRGSAVAIDCLNGWKNHREIFVVTADGGIGHRDRWAGKEWPPWRDLAPPQPIKDVGSGITSTGRIEILAVDRRGSLWQRSYADQVWWGNWRPVLGLRADPTAW
jgi:hypothetical protein